MQKLNEEERALALSIAGKTLEIYLGERRRPTAAELGVPEGGIFHELRAVFVTLKKRGALRGCIGHIIPHEELWESITHNAVSAAVEDHRFPPVTAAELPELELDISVLTPPVEVAGPEGFEVGRHGVILEVGLHRAVFLPQVAPEQGWDRETTLTHLSLKAGLELDGWRRPDARFKVFEAQVFP